MSDQLPRFYYVANRMFRLALPLGRVRVTVIGRENVPLKGPLLMTSNHQSNLDPPLIGGFLPRDVVMMSKAENFQGNALLRWVVVNYGAFPVRRGEGDVGAIRRALQVLKEGRALYVAPEGTRSRNGIMQEPQPGVALLALRSGAPILPIGISGIEHFAHRIGRWQPIPVTITVGHPYRLISPTPKPDRATLLAMSDAIMDRIALLLPERHRGRFGQSSETPQFIEEIGTNQLAAGEQADNHDLVL
jgi:1-acyl-sn-glycerol-3-phosphate acyltransferase